MKKSTFLLLVAGVSVAFIALANSEADSRSPRQSDQMMAADGRDVDLYGIKVGQTLHIDWPENHDFGNYRIAILSDTTAEDTEATGGTRYWTVIEVSHDYVIVDETVNLSAWEGQVFQKTIPRHSIAVVTRMYKKADHQMGQF